MQKKSRPIKDYPYTPFSKPKIGSLGTTGLWRSFKPVIDQEKCNSCLLCWLYCPEGTVQLGEDGSIAIDYTYCKGCGICALECARKAITMEREFE
ncbi:MAG: 4Fe-4S binding protein [Candidatus Bathyarchaeia archaeon]